MIIVIDKKGKSLIFMQFITYGYCVFDK